MISRPFLVYIAARYSGRSFLGSKAVYLRMESTVSNVKPAKHRD